MFGKWFSENCSVRQLLAETARLDEVIGHIWWAEQYASTWRGYDISIRADARFFAGDWSDARADYHLAAELEPDGFLDGHHRSIALAAAAYAGEAAAYAGEDVLDRMRQEHAIAKALVEDNPLGQWEVLINVVEGLAVLGRQEETADLHATMAKGIGKGRGVSFHGRLWQMVAGIAAAGGKRWNAAEEHFETALREAAELPAVLAQPETRRWYSRMLLNRDQDGDQDTARTLLGEAVE